MSPLWPFPTKSDSQIRRIDQGQDLQYPGTIPVPVLAVASGRVSMGGPDPQGFGPGYPVLTLDHPAPGGPAVYYGHTFIIKALIGHHVIAGTPIGMTGGLHSGGNAYNDSNWLEIGFWSSGPIGNGQAMHDWLTGAVSAPVGPANWYVIALNGNQNNLKISQKPFPKGATVIIGPMSKTDAENWLAGLQGVGKEPPILSNPLSGLEAVNHFFANLASRDFLIRAAEVLIGGAIVLVAIGTLLSNTKAGKKVIKTAPALFAPEVKAAAGVTKAIKPPKPKAEAIPRTGGRTSQGTQGGRASVVPTKSGSAK